MTNPNSELAPDPSPAPLSDAEWKAFMAAESAFPLVIVVVPISVMTSPLVKPALAAGLLG